MSVPGYRIHELQVADLAINENVGTSGGVLVAVAAGGTARVALFDPDNGFVSLAQPVAAVRGKFRFAVLESVQSIDVYGTAPGGQSFQRLGIKAQAKPEIWISSNQGEHVMVIPFNFADFTIGSSVDTGFDEPANAIFKFGGCAVDVVDVDATETIDVGPTADPNGFQAAASIATAGLVSAKGALLATAGTPLDHFSAGENIELLLSAGTDTGSGFIRLPYSLPVVGA